VLIDLDTTPTNGARQMSRVSTSSSGGPTSC